MTVDGSSRPAAGTMITVIPVGAALAVGGQLRAATLADRTQRPAMTPDEARTMLGVPDRH